MGRTMQEQLSRTRRTRRVIMDIKTMFFRWTVFNSVHNGLELSVFNYKTFVLFVSFVVSLHKINMEYNHDAV